MFQWLWRVVLYEPRQLPTCMKRGKADKPRHISHKKGNGGANAPFGRPSMQRCGQQQDRPAYDIGEGQESYAKKERAVTQRCFPFIVIDRWLAQGAIDGDARSQCHHRDGEAIYPMGQRGSDREVNESGAECHWQQRQPPHWSLWPRFGVVGHIVPNMVRCMSPPDQGIHSLQQRFTFCAHSSSPIRFKVMAIDSKRRKEKSISTLTPKCWAIFIANSKLGL